MEPGNRIDLPNTMLARFISTKYLVEVCSVGSGSLVTGFYCVGGGGWDCYSYKVMLSNIYSILRSSVGGSAG